MPASWRAIAPIWRYWDIAEAIGAGVELARGIRVERTPGFIQSATAMRYLTPAMQDRVKNESPYCLSLLYEASRVDDPEPNWRGPGTTTRQIMARGTLELASLAMWIARPASIGIEVVFHTSRPDGLAAGQIDYPGYLYPRESELANQLTAADFQKAQQLHEAILEVEAREEDRAGTVWSSIRFLWKSLLDTWKETRLLLQWVALEALFGPEDAHGEIRYRLAQRAAFFLGTDPSDAQRWFDIAKRGYDWRSRIVHGVRIKKLDRSKADEIIGEAETLVRCSLTKILLTPGLVDTFNGRDRENYLDAQVFSSRGGASA